MQCCGVETYNTLVHILSIYMFLDECKKIVKRITFSLDNDSGIENDTRDIPKSHLKEDTKSLTPPLSLKLVRTP